MRERPVCSRRIRVVLLCFPLFISLLAGAFPVLAQEPTATPDPVTIALEPSPSGLIALVQHWGIWVVLVVFIIAVAFYYLKSYVAGTSKPIEGLGEKHANHLLNTIQQHDQAQEARKALDVGTSSYLRWLQDELKHLPILPIKSAERTEQLRLSDVYVPLRVVERTQMESFRRLTMGEFDAGGEFRLRQEAFQQLEQNQRVYRLLSDQNMLSLHDQERPRRRSPRQADTPPAQESTTTRLLLVGDAGSGKTTTLHYGALVLALDYEQQRTEGAPQRLDLHCAQPLLPFYIRLTLVATYVREARERATRPEDLIRLQDAPGSLLLDWLDSYTCSQVKTHQRNIPNNMPSQRMQDGGCLVMLDGLDETGDEQERAYMQRLILNVQQDYPDNRYLVASRPFADLRLPGFAERHLSPMNGEEMRTLLKNWFGAMQEASATHKQRERAADQEAYLWGILEHNARLFEMATNPLLLTSMALLVYTGTGLPRQRAKIYYELVDLLLQQWRLQQKASGLPGRRESHPPLYGGEENEESVRRRLQTLAAWMQEEQRREIRLHEAQEQLRPDYATFMGWHRERSDDYVCRLMESLSLESGLVQRRDNGYSFAHYTLQEYLTARAYDERDNGVAGLFAHVHLPRWRETILLAVGHWANTGKPGYACDLLRQLLDTQDTAALLLAAAALDDADADRVLELTPLRTETLQRLRDTAFSPDQCPTPKTRNEAAELLDRLGGDTRPTLDFTRPDYWAARIEPGDFILGDDNSNRDNEKPAMRSRILRPYALARFPITNHQYLAFLNDLEQQGRTEEARTRRPRHWSGKQYRAGEANHPVAMVTWPDLTAFAAWLDAYLKRCGIIPAGDRIRLATEPEWERAAAYPVSFPAGDLLAYRRRHPWGTDDTNLATHRAHTKESGIGGTSVVGIFPHGRADCGAEELAGNVWEWCATPYLDYKKYPPVEQLPVDVTEEQGEDRNHVLRGGSWYNEQVFSSCAFRAGPDLDPTYDGYGGRVVRLFS